MTNNNNSLDTLEKADNERGMYSVSYRELIWRNFLVGVSRGVGSIIIQFIFVAVIVSLTMRFVIPAMESFVTNLTNSLNPINIIQEQTMPSLDQLMNLSPLRRN